MDVIAATQPVTGRLSIACLSKKLKDKHRDRCTGVIPDFAC